MRAWALLPVLVLGCAAAPIRQKPAQAGPSVALSAAPARCEPERAAPPERVPADNRCLPRGLPKAQAAAEPADGATCIDQRSMERALAPVLQKRFERIASGLLDVGFGCDPLVAPIHEIVIETGYGHGGSLALWRLSRKDDSSAFDVTAVAHDTWLVPQDKGDNAKTVLIARGTLAARDLERALSRVRPALVSSVRELEPPPQPNAVGMHSMFFSSGNFHHYFRLRDSAGHELARAYTGYPNSGEQRQYLGIVYAMEQLEPLLERFEFERQSPSNELRAWYSAHVVSAWPRLGSSDAWWVRERMVSLGGKLGETSLVPMIVSELERGVAEVAKAKPDEARARTDRYLTDPLRALSAVTGWDARQRRDGSEQALLAAAREAISECRSAM